MSAGPIAQMIRVGADLIDGRLDDPMQAVRAIMAVAVELAPEDELRRHLTAAARERAERLADMAEAAKFREVDR